MSIYRIAVFCVVPNRNCSTEIVDKTGTVQDYPQSIEYLSSWLKRAYGQPAYILLDEYDSPMMAAYLGGYYSQMTSFIRSFMVQSFKDNPNLKQGVVIGILKEAQESIFSDFNNPGGVHHPGPGHGGLLWIHR